MTCIHYLASGVDLIATINSIVEHRRIIRALKNGRGVVDAAARDFEELIQAGWVMVPRPAGSYSQLREAIASIVGQSSVGRARPNIGSSPGVRKACDGVVVEEDSRWMDEKDFRVACQAQGYETPDDIWS